MSDESTTKPVASKDPLPDDPIADDVFASVASYRRVGQTFIAVLAGIPAVTLLSSLVRAPGENGFDENTLAAGLVAVALALGLGVALVVWIRAPIDLEDDDDDLLSFKMSRIVGARKPTYKSLLEQIDRITRSPEISHESEVALKSALRVRQRAYQLVAADKMRERVTNMLTTGLFVVTLAVATLGVFLLAISPRPKETDSTTVQLVSITLTPAGQKALGCDAAVFTGLQVGGDAASPIVIPSDTACSAGKLLTLTVGEEAKLASKVEPVKAATVTTTQTTPGTTTEETTTG